ncbi:DUF397 domain-containing protein [Saccharopolyspora hattusasensis]|uniref:DUF397 domain-containing protein n=1 Tax=Saccharopolyspora hattusasensis TaxID=1128679 RepID=UPI003D95865B
MDTSGDGLGCLSDGVDTCTRISDPALGQEPRTHTRCLTSVWQRGVGVRDTKDRDGGTLLFTPEQWTSFSRECETVLEPGFTLTTTWSRPDAEARLARS